MPLDGGSSRGGGGGGSIASSGTRGAGGRGLVSARASDDALPQLLPLIDVGDSPSAASGCPDSSFRPTSPPTAAALAANDLAYPCENV